MTFESQRGGSRGKGAPDVQRGDAKGNLFETGVHGQGPKA